MEDIPDTKKQTCAFGICCVVSEKSFLLIADTQKAKHQWIKAISKVSSTQLLSHRLTLLFKNDYATGSTCTYL